MHISCPRREQWAAGGSLIRTRDGQTGQAKAKTGHMDTDRAPWALPTMPRGKQTEGTHAIERCDASGC